jgi:hypothetical protein
MFEPLSIFGFPQAHLKQHKNTLEYLAVGNRNGMTTASPLSFAVHDFVALKTLVLRIWLPPHWSWDQVVANVLNAPNLEEFVYDLSALKAHDCLFKGDLGKRSMKQLAGAVALGRHMGCTLRKVKLMWPKAGLWMSKTDLVENLKTEYRVVSFKGVNRIMDIEERLDWGVVFKVKGEQTQTTRE